MRQERSGTRPKRTKTTTLPCWPRAGTSSRRSPRSSIPAGRKCPANFRLTDKSKTTNIGRIPARKPLCLGSECWPALPAGETLKPERFSGLRVFTWHRVCVTGQAWTKIWQLASATLVAAQSRVDEEFLRQSGTEELVSGRFARVPSPSLRLQVHGHADMLRQSWTHGTYLGVTPYNTSPGLLWFVSCSSWSCHERDVTTARRSVIKCMHVRRHRLRI